MTCPKCGNSLTEGAKFCTACGSSIESNATPTQTNIPADDQRFSATGANVAAPDTQTAQWSAQAPQTPSYTMPSDPVITPIAPSSSEFSGGGGNGGKKKSSKKGLVAVLVVLLTGGLIVGAVSLFGGGIGKLFMSDENYAKKVYTESVDAILETLKSSSDTSAIMETFSTVKVDAELKSSFSGDYIDKVMDEVYGEYAEYYQEEKPLFEIMGDSVLSMSFQYKLDEDTEANPLGMEFAGDAAWKVGGKDIITAQMATEAENLLIALPELFSQVLKTSLDASYGDVVDEFSYYSYYSVPDFSDLSMDDLIGVTEGLGDGVVPFASTFTAAFFDELEYTLIKGMSIDVNGTSASVDAAVLSLSEADVMKATLAGLKAVQKNDKDIIALLDYLNLVAQYSGETTAMGSQEFNLMLTSAITQIEEELKNEYYFTEKEIEIALYSDSAGKLRGGHLKVLGEYSSDGNGMTVAIIPNVGYCIDFMDTYTGSEYSYDNSFKIFGDLNEKSGKYSGNMKYSDEEGEVHFLDFADVELVDFMGAENINGKFTVLLGNLMKYEEDQYSYSDYPDFIKNTVITFNLTSTSKVWTLDLAFVDTVDNASISLKADFEYGAKVKIEAPKGDVVDIDSFEPDVEEFKESIKKIGEELKKQGYDITEYIDEMIYSYEYYGYY